MSLSSLDSSTDPLLMTTPVCAKRSGYPGGPLKKLSSSSQMGSFHWGLKRARASWLISQDFRRVWDGSWRFSWKHYDKSELIEEESYGEDFKRVTDFTRALDDHQSYGPFRSENSGTNICVKDHGETPMMSLYTFAAVLTQTFLPTCFQNYHSTPGDFWYSKRQTI